MEQNQSLVPEQTEAEAESVEAQLHTAALAALEPQVDTGETQPPTQELGEERIRGLLSKA